MSDNELYKGDLKIAPTKVRLSVTPGQTDLDFLLKTANLKSPTC